MSPGPQPSDEPGAPDAPRDLASQILQNLQKKRTERRGRLSSDVAKKKGDTKSNLIFKVTGSARAGAHVLVRPLSMLPVRPASYAAAFAWLPLFRWRFSLVRRPAGGGASGRRAGREAARRLRSRDLPAPPSSMLVRKIASRVHSFSHCVRTHR
ncbi:unnamed protein product [Leptosia nina]|uniref:Uncharacterized protein n=1 Tax=Leptosia nina TaxID=320188 RepID=A0AAV1JUE5_9NEOP